MTASFPCYAGTSTGFLVRSCFNHAFEVGRTVDFSRMLVEQNEVFHELSRRFRNSYVVPLALYRLSFVI